MKNRKVAAGLALAGALTLPGMHRFYLGQSRWGLAYLALAWGTPLSRIASAIEALWYLSLDEAEFDRAFGDGTGPLAQPLGTGIASAQPATHTQANADAALAMAAALRELERLRQDGLLTNTEFEQQRQQLSSDVLTPVQPSLLTQLKTLGRSGLGAIASPSPAATPIDVNQASIDDWITLPGISIHQARSIVQLSQSGVQYHDLEDLAAVLGIPVAHLTPLSDRLQFCYYDGPEIDRLDPNLATDAELMRLPGLDASWADRIIQERSSGPYRNLADLQTRLSISGELLSQTMHSLRFDSQSLT
jgi:DNA uptake protein ComE-like DNA-binding protein/TM2 domain-containing membrane protein YozV